MHRDRRLPARPLQGLLQRALRHAHLRLGPRRPAELRGRRPRRLRHLPGRRPRDRRAAARGHPVPLQPGDPALRPAPQPRRLLGDERQRRPPPRQRDLRQRARDPDGRRDRRRAPRLPGRLRAVRAQRHLLEQLQPLRPGRRRRSPRSRSPSARASWIAGGNNHTVRNNRIWDNWRRGTMLFAVPDSLICGPAADGNMQAGCDPNSVSTSYNNSYYGNVMGVAPGWQPRRPTAPTSGGTRSPATRGNCWYDNTGAAPDHDAPEPAAGLRRRHEPGLERRARATRRTRASS